MKTASIQCETVQLKKAMKFLKPGLPKNKKAQLLAHVELTIKTNEVEFVLTGSATTMYCKTVGVAKFTIPYTYFEDIIKTQEPLFSRITVKQNNSIKINELEVEAKTWFFKNDKILRSIDLPINYSVADLLMLEKKYTKEEIEFNGFDKHQKKAKEDLGLFIGKAHEALKMYGVTKQELKQLTYWIIRLKPCHPFR